jgi:hypothetical protein
VEDWGGRDRIGRVCRDFCSLFSLLIKQLDFTVPSQVGLLNHNKLLRFRGFSFQTGFFAEILKESSEAAMARGGRAAPFFRVNDSEKTHGREARQKPTCFLDYLPAITVQPIEGNQTMYQF